MMNKSITLDDFYMLCVLGKGSYAKVVLVKRKDTGEIMALKILKKEMIERRKQEEHVKTEREVLGKVIHPFIAKMHCAFQNEKKLYFALEYCPGGELFNLLQKRKFFSEDQAKFYVSQIVLGIEFLHSMDFIYRDLKPENVLLDAQGYIRITDFGLSKGNVTGGKDARSVCGTPEYLAPEIIMRVGHGKAVDWWTVGCLIYELLTGLPPYYTNSREELFDKIKLSSVKMPSHFTANVKDLLNGLFQKDPEKRLGNGPEGAKAIRDHPWFNGIDWEAMLRKEIKAPFIPVIKGELDVSNFDTEFTETAVESYKNNTFDVVYNNYDNFTYDDNGAVMME